VHNVVIQTLWFLNLLIRHLLKCISVRYVFPAELSSLVVETLLLAFSKSADILVTKKRLLLKPEKVDILSPNL